MSLDNIREIHNHYDAVFKEAMTLYKNKTLDFLGVDFAMIEEPISTEITEVHVKKGFADMGFILKDKTGLHIEWEVNINDDDMRRFCSYYLDYIRTYKMRFTTIIITNRSQSVKLYEDEMLRFSPLIINLGERNGDLLLEQLKENVKKKRPVNELELIYLPLYHSKYKNTAEMLEQVVELAPLATESKAESEKIMILSALAANKFIEEKDYQRIWEAIKMYVDDLTFVKFAKRDAKAEVVVTMLKKNLDIDTIAEYTGLSVDEVKEIEKQIAK